MPIEVNNHKGLCMMIFNLVLQYLKTCQWLVAVGVLFGGLALQVQAQTDEEYRMEVGGGVGTSFYLGDVNSGFYKNSGIAYAAQLRFVLHPRATIKLQLGRAGIKGNTGSVRSIFPLDPSSGAVSTTPLQYAFSEHVTSMSGLYELHFLPYGYYRGYQNHVRLVPYLQAGIGLHYAEKNKAFTPSLPMGFGLKYKVSPRLNVGLDWLVHFTMSDKLDGLDSPNGVRGAGFKNKDHYITTSLTLTYDIAPHCVTCNKDNR